MSKTIKYVECAYCGYKLDKPEPFSPLFLD